MYSKEKLHHEKIHYLNFLNFTLVFIAKKEFLSNNLTSITF